MTMVYTCVPSGTSQKLNLWRGKEVTDACKFLMKALDRLSRNMHVSYMHLECGVLLQRTKGHSAVRRPTRSI